MRLIIYTGKGGVGKTSTSAATAYRLSELGYRTILMSTDSAHSLGDSLDFPLGTAITPVRENLDALEIDIIHEMRTKWSSIQEYISSFMLSQGMGEISAEEMAILPGMEMISALFYVNQFEETDAYDVVVMDTAPTGETLRLLSFPDVTNWYLDKAYPFIRRIMKFAKATVGKFMDVPLPDDSVMAAIEEIKRNMEKVKVILEDPQKTTVRLVLNPEKMVIRETMRAYTYLSLYNKNVEALVVNKVYPEEAAGSEFMRGRMEEQAENMELIHSAFDPMEIKYCGMMSTELRGADKLREMARAVYGDENPSNVYSDARPKAFNPLAGADVLELRMPFVDRTEVELFRTDAITLVVHVGSQKRNIQLPDTLVRAEISGAEFKDDKLIIKFKRRAYGGRQRVRRFRQTEQGPHREDDRSAEGRGHRLRRRREDHRGRRPRAGQGARRAGQGQAGEGHALGVRDRHGPRGPGPFHEDGHGVLHGHGRHHAEGPRARLRQGGLRRHRRELEACVRGDGLREAEGGHNHRRRRAPRRGRRLQGDQLNMGFGGDAVALARASVEAEVLGRGAPETPSEGRFSEPSGAFVTLSTYPRGELRGCIGYPMPAFPLGEAIVLSAESACHDPRFPDLSAGELDSITVEVTVLTVPKEIIFNSPQELLDSIEIGRDGLIAESRGRRGLLLPQVPVEWGWDKAEYLDHLCVKAGLPHDSWRRPGIRVQSFTGEIRHEESPRGPVTGGD